MSHFLEKRGEGQSLVSGASVSSSAQQVGIGKDLLVSWGPLGLASLQFQPMRLRPSRALLLEALPCP